MGFMDLNELYNNSIDSLYSYSAVSQIINIPLHITFCLLYL